MSVDLLGATAGVKTHITPYSVRGASWLTSNAPPRSEQSKHREGAVMLDREEGLALLELAVSEGLKTATWKMG